MEIHRNSNIYIYIYAFNEKKSPNYLISERNSQKAKFPQNGFFSTLAMEFRQNRRQFCLLEEPPAMGRVLHCSGTRSASWNSNCSAQMETAPGDQPAFARKAFSEGRSAIRTPCTAFSIPTHSVPMHIQVQRWRMQHYACGGTALGWKCGGWVGIHAWLGVPYPTHGNVHLQSEEGTAPDALTRGPFRSD